MNYRQVISYLLTFAIVLISFFLYSSNYYALLNSDDALNVLMAHYYQLPNDFYCWGQDRGGTLIPLVSQIFIKLFGCSALTSVSLSNYLILILGYLGLSSIIKSNYYKIILAVIWFLPFERFVDIVRFPIGVEYSLIGFSIPIINVLMNRGALKWYAKHLLLFLLVLIFTLSVWVSDLAIVSIAVLLFTLYLFYIIRNKRFVIDKLVSIYFVVGTVCCFGFLRFAKSFAVVKTANYLSLNSISGFGDAFCYITDAWWKLLTFSTNEILVSAYVGLSILFIVVFTIYVLKNKFLVHVLSNQWITFFLADFIAVLAVFFSSSWVLSNEMGRWYFVASYISLGMFVILLLDSIKVSRGYNLLKYSLLGLVLVGAVSPVYNMKYVRPKTLKPMVDVVGEFRQLGEIGLISEFWNSYIASCPDPELIKATPHDRSSVRNQEIVDMVFERENIFVVKDMWLNTFPDTLEQFGYVLLKDGRQFELGGCEVCKYRRAKLNKSFSLKDIKSSDNHLVMRGIGTADVLFVPSNGDSCNQKYIVCGPSIPIGIGVFSAEFSIKANNFENDKPIALLDVVANHGTIKLAELTLDKNDFAANDFSSFSLVFKTTKRYSDIDFRILFYGNANLYFSRVDLTEQ